MAAAQHAPRARTAAAVNGSRSVSDASRHGAAAPSMGQLLASCAAARTVSTPPSAEPATEPEGAPNSRPPQAD